MQTKTKTLIHYIVNTIVVIVTIGVLVVTCSVPVYKWTNLNIFTFAFLVVSVTSLLFNTILTIAFANEVKKPLGILLPLLISMLLLGLLGGAIVKAYDSFLTIENLHELLIIKYPFQGVLLIMLGILLTILIMFIQVYVTKFSLLSVSGNRAREWEINSSFSLSRLKLKVEHKNNFTYIWNNKNIFVIKFISENEIERKLLLQDIEEEKASPEIVELQNEVKRLYGSGDIHGVLSYLSNKTPEVFGENKEVIVVKNNELFQTIKKIESTRETNHKKLEVIL